MRPLFRATREFSVSFSFLRSPVMSRILLLPRHSSLATLLLLFALPISAQVITGTPPFGSFGGGPDVINLANLNAHLTIPVFARAGRGLPFNFYITYDSSVWYPLTSSGTTYWQPVTNWGWGGSEVNIGKVVPILLSATGGTCGSIPHLGITMTMIYGWTYDDGFGTPHPFAPTSTVYSNSCTGGWTTGFTGAQASDDSGYSLSVNGSTVVSLYSADGSLINASSIEDRNGNEVTKSSGVFTDTLGTTALTIAGSGTPTSPITYTYTPPNTASAKCGTTAGVACYTVNYTQYTVATNFGNSTIKEFGATSEPLVSSIVLPDGSEYSFKYEVTPSIPTSGACSPLANTYSEYCVTSRLASVTFPTGGTIYYSYVNGNNGILPDGSAATLQRVTPDGNWTYTQVKNTGAGTTTTVTDPSSGANQTVIQFQGMYETTREAYQGSSTGGGTLLHTWDTCYNGETGNCPTTAITPPISQRLVTDIYGLSGLQSMHQYFYDASGGLTQQLDYDYGSSGHGALLRTIVVTYAPLGYITAFQQTVTVCNGTGNNSACNGNGTVVAQTNYNYDQATLQPTSGITQHVSVSGSRGNLTGINYPVSGLTANFTYYDTGVPYTSQDVNGATTTYNYSSTNNAYCNWAFPTSITEPGVAAGSMTQSYAWNCTGGVMKQLTDENGQTIQTTYNDPYYWRRTSSTDRSNFTTNYCYAALSGGSCPTAPSTNQIESYLNFNSGNSTSDSLTTLDSLGRVHIQQTRQSPSSANFDSVETDYDALGRPSRLTVPYVATAGQTCPAGPSCPATVLSYDPLSRVSQVTDGGGGRTTYTYSPTSTDITMAMGPAPSGENLKQRQLEYDGLGRLTSVCEITATLSGYGTCSQNSSPQPSGYWSKYTYDAQGDLLTVTQNAQAPSGQQTRSYSFDAMGRLTSETNPESGTTSYTYDTIASGTCASTYYGDLIKRVDAIGNIACNTYDKLHRLLTETYTTTSPTVATPNKCFVYDAVIDSQTASNIKTRLGEAYTTTSACSQTTLPSTITDEAFSYTARGELTNIYQLSPHSASYYNLSQTYWDNGAPNALSGNIGLPSNITYGVDGEGRTTTVSATAGQNPVTSVSDNLYASPYQFSVTLGSGDSDVFTFDSNTFRLNKYQFNIGSQTVTGTVGWNPNWSLGSLGISDPFNSANTQTCNFSADDLARTSQVSCPTIWGQNFSYDSFGNIQKNVISGDGGTTFAPCYQSSPVTNRIALVGGSGSNCTGGTAPTYDADGNSLNDTFRTYTWDANNNAASIGSVGVTYDALNHMVEQSVSGIYTDIVYSPLGAKLALMNATSTPTLNKAFVPLTGGATAVYTSSGLNYYRHADWLGSSRFASTTSQGLYADYAYSPFGEPYAQFGTIDPSFTGQNQDTTSGLYDFLYREYDPNQSRWTHPDPAGLAAASPTNPQSWDRYSYAFNAPTNFVDLGGLCPLIVAGVNDTPENSPGILNYAQQIGADVAFPYAGQSTLAAVGSILGQDLGVTNGAEQTTQAALQDAGSPAQNADGNNAVNAIAFSGGAQATTSAVNDLGSSNVNLTSAVYLEPGTGLITGLVGGLATGSNQTAIVRGKGFLNGVLNAITQPNGIDVFHTNCGHSANCVFGQLKSNAGPVNPQNTEACKNPKVFARGRKPRPIGGGGGGNGFGYFVIFLTYCSDEGGCTTYPVGGGWYWPTPNRPTL
jgi:RHS repeat-associated protein